MVQSVYSLDNLSGVLLEEEDEELELTFFQDIQQSFPLPAVELTRQAHIDDGVHHQFLVALPSVTTLPLLSAFPVAKNSPLAALTLGPTIPLSCLGRLQRTMSLGFAVDEWHLPILLDWSSWLFLKRSRLVAHLPRTGPHAVGAIVGLLNRNWRVSSWTTAGLSWLLAGYVVAPGRQLLRLLPLLRLLLHAVPGLRRFYLLLRLVPSELLDVLLPLHLQLSNLL